MPYSVPRHSRQALTDLWFVWSKGGESVLFFLCVIIVFADVCAAIYSSVKTQEDGGIICHTFMADITLAQYHSTSSMASWSSPPLLLLQCTQHPYGLILILVYYYHKLQISGWDAQFSVSILEQSAEFTAAPRYSVISSFLMYLVLCIMVTVCTACVEIRVHCVYTHGALFVHCQQCKSKQALKSWRACKLWAQLVSRGKMWWNWQNILSIQALDYRLPPCLQCSSGCWEKKRSWFGITAKHHRVQLLLQLQLLFLLIQQWDVWLKR